MAVENHGSGRQLLRIQTWPRCAAAAVTLTVLFAGLALGAAIDGIWPVAIALSGMAFLVLRRTVQECSVGMAGFLGATREVEKKEKIVDKGGTDEQSPL
jgi:hypothetical protein